MVLSTSTGPFTSWSHGLDPAEIETVVTQVCDEALYWFPVRHHSPTVARHVVAAIAQRRPRVVFIEGPCEANDLIPHVPDRNTRPPIALYSSYREDDATTASSGIASVVDMAPFRVASWYPLLDYSPEYAAMQAAAKVGADVVLIDLPHYAWRQHGVIRQAAEASEPGVQLVSVPDSEDLLSISEFYLALAQHAGFRSWHQAWDSLFEFGPHDRDYEWFRYDLAAFCAAARVTTPAELLEGDGTIARERFMWATICDTLEERQINPDQAMAVCGGFHLFLDRQDTTLCPELPTGTVYTAVVPYSFTRLSEQSGYDAGNRAPQFYQSVWELRRKGNLEDLLAQHVVAILKRARQRGDLASSADAIAVVQHARMFASLRGRAMPILDDIHDAVITCCCKGDPETEGRPWRKAIAEVDIGNRIGKVTSELGLLPLAKDFYELVEQYGWGETLGHEKPLQVTLNKQDDHDRRRAAFLHRLTYLAIPFAKSLDADNAMAGALFREQWRLQWRPSLDPALIEKNLYGDTVEMATLAQLRETLANDTWHAGRMCQQLRRALNMDLPELMPNIEAICGHAIARGDRFISLGDALVHLMVIQRQATHAHLPLDTLDDLLETCFERACFALPSVMDAPDLSPSSSETM